jgi:cell division inhibitor SulA/protein ImuA
LTEILSPHQGREALRLMVPALIRLSREARWIAWVAPPYLPYAPGLAGRGVELSRLLMITPGDERMCLWGLEQALRSGACSAALAWQEQMEMSALRRLQLAAETGNALAFLFRPEQAAQQASPAVLRLRVRCLADGMAVDVLKRQGGWAVGPLRLEESAGQSGC